MDLTKEIRKQFIEDIFSTENINRKSNSLYNFDFYKNNHQPHVYKALCEDYGGDNKAVDQNRNLFSINITKKIVDAISTVYMDEPTRNFTGDDRETELLDKTYSLASVNKSLKKANKYVNLNHQCLISVLPRNGKIETKVLAPHMYDVLCDPRDPEEAIAVVTMFLKPGATSKTINVSSKKSASDYYYYWVTASQIFHTDHNGQIIDEILDNPINTLPFVEIAKDKDHEYWIDEGSSIVDFAKEFLLCLCDTANISKLQGFAQAVLMSEEKPEDLTIGPNNYIHLQINKNSSIQPSFEFASPNPDLSSSIQFLEKMLSMFLTSIDVDPGTISSSGSSQRFTSGLDRFLAGVEKFQASKDSLELFYEAEEKLFEIIRLWSNQLQQREGTDSRINLGLIGEDVELAVDFAKPEQVQSEKEKIEIIEKKLQLGLISLREAIALDRGIDVDQVEDIVDEVVEEAE